jgi:hypothetical protein
MECSESAKEHELLFNTEICPTLTIIIFLYPRPENLMPLSPYLTIKSFSEQFVQHCRKKKLNRSIFKQRISN